MRTSFFVSLLKHLAVAAQEYRFTGKRASATPRRFPVSLDWRSYTFRASSRSRLLPMKWIESCQKGLPNEIAMASQSFSLSQTRFRL
jgi:hypothetical protein